ncbi:MAG: HDOD domain-containing protein [Planctomycetota bacterium]
MKPRSKLSAREVADLRTALARRIGDSSVPTLPQIAMKVVDLVSDDNATIADFSRVISADQSLSGRLLRMANSAYYAQRHPVTRIDRAMVLLGLDKLKAVALGFHLSKALLEADDGFSFRRQWTQSLFRAWFSLRLTTLFDQNAAGEAFLVGLLSDAGVPLMPSLIGDRYYEIVSPTQSPAERFDSEWNGLLFTHVDVSAALCQIWKLPEVLALPITEHHSRPASIVVGGPSSLLLRGVAYLAGTMAIDPDLPAQSIRPQPQAARDLFGLEASDMRALLREVEQDFSASREVFDSMVDPSVLIEDIIDRASVFLGDETALEETDEPVGESIEFATPGLRFRVEPVGSGRVRVTISDDAGIELVTEQIEPATRTDEQMREVLMLDDADPDIAGSILDGVRKSAA